MLTRQLIDLNLYGTASFSNRKKKLFLITLLTEISEEPSFRIIIKNKIFSLLIRLTCFSSNDVE